MLSLQLLGPPQLLLDGRPLAVPRRKSRALLWQRPVHLSTLEEGQGRRLTSDGKQVKSTEFQAESAKQTEAV